MSTTELMRERLEAALQADATGRRQLSRWLFEKDLPPRSRDEEPYVWILRGLSAVDDFAPAVRKLAAWTAELIDEGAEEKCSAPEGDQYLFNLLRLSAALASPDELWGPLLRMYERRKVAGKYDGLNHRSSLLLALVKNQADTRLRDTWLRIAEGKEESFFEGNPEDGLWALMHAPDPEKGRGHPDFGGLGRALSFQVADVLADRVNRRASLVHIFRRLSKVYPNANHAFQIQCVLWADSFDWPWWAVTALPSLSVVTRREGSAAQVLLWKIYQEYVFEGLAAPVRSYCGGLVLEAQVDLDAWISRAPIIAELEERRLTSPLQSERALKGDLNQRLLELQSERSHRNQDCNVLGPIRRGFVRELTSGAASV